MEVRMAEAEKPVLDKVKSSFPYWQDKELKKKFEEHANWKSGTQKFVLRLLLLLLAVYVVGTSIRKTKTLSIWYYKNHKYQHNENCTLSKIDIR